MKNTILTLFYISVVAFTLHAEDRKDKVQQDFGFFIQQPEVNQEIDAEVLELIEWLVEEEATTPAEQHITDFLQAKSIQVMCLDDAGTSTRTYNGNPAGTTTIMCPGDNFTVTHNSNAIITGDGDPLTTPGVDLGIFVVPPTVSGPLVSDISGMGSANAWADPSMMNIPTLVSTDQFGNISFIHQGIYNNIYNPGGYVQLYFAHVTLDDVNSTPKILSEDIGGTNECVNINTSDVFSIVFLADIDTSDFETPAGGNLCQGTIDVIGGLAEYDASDYTISIELSTNPAITGTITSTVFKHDSQIIFNVPETGIYNFIVTDNNGCSKVFPLNMTACPACTDDAGTETVSLAPSALSMTPNLLYPGDTLNIVHDGNQNLGGDPSPSTPSGVQYAIYTCPPTITGQLLSDITNDPCIITDGTGTVPQLVSNIDIDGDGFIRNNSTTYQGYLANAGLTSLDTLWFAPITVDAFPPASWETNVPNECTNVNISANAVFPVVFLNDISITAFDNTNTNTGNDCEGTITVTGGLPELDGSNYTVTVSLLSNPAITGSLVTGASHGGTMVFSVPQPGNYTITVSDNNGGGSASGTNVIQIIDMKSCPAACSNFTLTGGISSDYNGANISCSGMNDGEIIVSPIGGNYPYVYTWSHDNTLNDSTATTLMAGIYDVTITDQDGCTLDTTITLTDPNLLFVGISGDMPLCNGDSTGLIYVTPGTGIGGGTPPYNFTWTSNSVIIGTNNDTLSGVPASQFGVTVIDANGCSATASLTLGEPTVVSGSFTTRTDATCSDVSNGSAAITPTLSSGVGNYTYAWAHDPTLTDSISTTLGVGRYYVTVTDGNGCTYADSVDIAATLVVTATLDSTDVNCYGGNDGTVTVTPMTTGGTPNLPYNYTWSPNATNTMNTATGLTAGTYQVTVADNLGCTYIDSILVNEPDSIIITVLNTSNILCSGEATGSIEVAATGGTPIVGTTGTPSYMYDWGSGNTDSLLANVPAGDYIVTVTDDNGCTKTLPVSIIQPPALILDSVTNVMVSCNGAADGALTAYISGGTGVYSYAWNTNPTIDTLNNISGLIAGTYFLTTTDASSCTKIDTFIVAEPMDITTNTAGVNQSCFNVIDGEVSVAVTGGTAPYIYAWSDLNNSTTDTVRNLLAGMYYVTVTDSNGCAAMDSVMIIAPPMITSTMAVDSVSCENGTDGQAMVTAMGGTGGFTYVWNNGQTGATATQLGAGRYVVTITDISGCSIQDTAFVTELSRLNPAGGIVSTPVSCFGGSDGSISILGMMGGTAPYTYTWTNLPTPQDSSTVINLPAGNSYQVVISDANGCSFGPVNITINQPSAPLTAAINADDVNCNGGTSGSITVVPTGGTPSYTYQWNDPNNQTTPTAVNLPIGTYTVTVTDANGCEQIASGAITEPVALDAIIEVMPTTCNGAKDGRIQMDTVIGGTGPYAYSLDGISYQPIDIIFFGLFGGNYDVYVRDANGCIYEETILVEEPEQIVVDLGPDIELELGDSAKLEALVNTFLPISYSWATSPTDTSMSCFDCPEPVVMPVRSTTYTVTIQDSTGCTASDDIYIKIDKNRNVFIPNAFTPNGDGKNDQFVVYGGTGVINVKTFVVYDRWGELVHSTSDFAPNDVSQAWDGEFRGQKMSPGVYVYFIEIEFSDGLTFPYKGDITLIR